MKKIKTNWSSINSEWVSVHNIQCVFFLGLEKPKICEAQYCSLSTGHRGDHQEARSQVPAWLQCGGWHCTSLFGFHFWHLWTRLSSHSRFCFYLMLQICSLMRGGIAERGGIRVGHRIIEINGQSVVATPQDKIIQILTTAIGEVRVKDKNTLCSCDFNIRVLLKPRMH